jgi:3-oxoacyl-[acyl-carrier-protein] synthase II
LRCTTGSCRRTPTATQADPACPLNLVGARRHRAPSLEAAISNSFAFGGTNSVLLFRRA